MFACSAATATTGPGWGGISPCITDMHDSSGSVSLQERLLRLGGQRQQDRQQQHEADREPGRQADGQRQRHHAPLDPLRPEERREPLGQNLGAAGFGEQLSQHRAQADDGRDPAPSRCRAPSRTTSRRRPRSATCCPARPRERPTINDASSSEMNALTLNRVTRTTSAPIATSAISTSLMSTGVTDAQQSRTRSSRAILSDPSLRRFPIRRRRWSDRRLRILAATVHSRALTAAPAINKANDVPDAARSPRRTALGARRWVPSSFLHPRCGPAAAEGGRRPDSFVRCRRARPRRARRLLAPVEPTSEVWAAGVTYLRSRDAREEESAVKDVYTRVYEAKRPELFFKANGWRVAGHDMPIRVRDDSAWNVPEPELALVINSAGEIVGHTVVQRRVVARHRGRQPALPAAGEGVQRLVRGRSRHPHRQHRPAEGSDDRPRDRARRPHGVHGRDAHVADQALARRAGRLPRQELDFPKGAFLSTGTGIVPGQDFSLTHGDVVAITIGGADDIRR